MRALSGAKISTAPCEAYTITVASGHSGRDREEPQYETVPPVAGLGGQAQGEAENPYDL